MKEVETRPGRTYAVECVGEVVVTNTETGAVVAQGDGSGQVFFTACSNSYTVSDDSAKFVELFKLAPRLRLTLLQGVAGGLLPRGFTELEYLESSGTQYINTGIVTDGTYTIFTTLRGKNQGSSNHSYGWRYDNSSSMAERFKGSTYWLIAFRYNWGGVIQEPQLDSSQVHDYIATEGQTTIIVDGKSFRLNALNTRLIDTSNPNNKTYYLFATNGGGKGIVCFYSFRMQDGAGNTALDLIPVLDAEGTPCMYDRVSKLRFYNSGTGTFGYRIKRTGETVAPMSLRDPWRVAPSGVYARRAGENELEVLADTEREADAAEQSGYTWFANTAEAYEHFGITQDEHLTE